MWDNTEDIARQILGYYGYDGGCTPGGFLSSLITTYAKADWPNRQRISEAFPVLARLMSVFEQRGVEDFKLIFLDN